MEKSLALLKPGMAFPSVTPGVSLAMVLARPMENNGSVGGPVICLKLFRLDIPVRMND